MSKPTEDELRPFFATIAARDTISDEEHRALVSAMGDRRIIAAGTDIAREGDRPLVSTLVLTGMTARYSTVEDGGRQITGLHLAGDFVDLHSFPLKIMDHSVASISRCTIAVVPHAELKHITEQFPHLTRVLWLLTLLEGSIHRQWLVAKGRLTADEQMAHLFCEQYVKAGIAGLTEGGRFALPLTQMQLGDALGLSIVHTNRTLQRLRRTRAIEWQDGIVQILDWDMLRELGQFDGSYLHLESVPR